MKDVLGEQVLSALAKLKPSATARITADSTLESLKLDSLDTITLLFELEEVAAVSISEDQIRGVTTVGDIIESIRRLKDTAAGSS